MAVLKNIRKFDFLSTPVKLTWTSYLQTFWLKTTLSAIAVVMMVMVIKTIEAFD